MPKDRRAFVPGECWFFTVNLFDRRRRLLTDHIGALRKATRRTQACHPFTIDAMAVLSNHIHAVWTLPPGAADFSLRLRLIKIDFAKAAPMTEVRSPVRVVRGSLLRLSQKISEVIDITRLLKNGTVNHL
jgi:putative transposase